MKHFKTIETQDEIKNLVLFKDPGEQVQPKDELVIQIEGTRLQHVLNIESVHREKVHSGWCYLAVTGIDDLHGLFNRNISQQ
ncbi:MAG TPA: hypothetical protein PLZ45_15125 [Ferruginibacter sp.]|nr:hypothetical protein [Ferruginibacter sp.]